MPAALPKRFENVVVIRENQRFGTYRATLDGRKVFVKLARTEGMKPSLLGELWGLRSFSELSLAADLPFAVPEIVDSGDGLIATSWAPGRPMRRFDGTTHSLDVQQLADIYAAIDVATELRGQLTNSFALPSKRGQNEAERLAALLRRCNYEGMIDPKLVVRSLDRLKVDVDKAPARLTHADLTPQHVLRTQSGRSTVIDYDSCSLLWPRFYDLVNYSCNAVVRDSRAASSCQSLVESFFEFRGISMTPHIEAMNISATVRALSSIYELMTKPNSMHNTTDSMSEERAETISLVLSDVTRGRFYLNKLTDQDASRQRRNTEKR